MYTNTAQIIQMLLNKVMLYNIDLLWKNIYNVFYLSQKLFTILMATKQTIA